MYCNERKEQRKIILLSTYLLLFSLVNVIAFSNFMFSSVRLLFDNLWDFSTVNIAFAIPNQLQIDNNDTLTATPRATNHPPVANVGINHIVNENSTVILVGAGSDPDLDDALSYVWRQTSGPAVDLINKTTGNPIFISPQVPTDTLLMFSLIVKDDKGAISNPAVVTVTVKHNNHPPLANAGENQSVQEGYAVSLDGSKSTDSDNELIKYTWLQVKGPPVKLDDMNAPDPTM